MGNVLHRVALVELYEAKRWPVEADKSFDPIDVLRYATEELGHTQAELAELLGSRSRASEILSRRCALTVGMIHKISEAWKYRLTFFSVLTTSNELIERRSGAGRRVAGISKFVVRVSSRGVTPIRRAAPSPLSGRRCRSPR